MKWLLIDGPNLCWAAFHTTGHLSNGVVFGFLKQVLATQDLLGADRLIFAFDEGLLKRQIIFPDYKHSRLAKTREGPAEDVAGRLEVQRQILMLKQHLLPEVGYSNVFYQGGFEADDIIADLSKLDWGADELILVSRDHDLYQLLRPGVSIFHPVDKKHVTEESFREAYDIDPKQWVDVKALTGCDTDDVPGVTGVAEKTAIKYLKGELTKGIIHERIVAAQEQINFNYKLVRLPFPGCPRFKIKQDSLTKFKWRSSMVNLRMTSLQTSFPIGAV